MSKDPKFPSTALQAAQAMEQALKSSLAYDAMLTTPGSVAYAEAMKTAALNALTQPSGLAAYEKSVLDNIALSAAHLSAMEAAKALVDLSASHRDPLLTDVSSQSVADAAKFLADMSIKDPYLSRLPAPSYMPAVTQKAATPTPVPEPITSPQALGRRVRQAREAMGMTQAAFADAAGVGRRFVSELENGKATLELGKVMAVCAAAGLDLLIRSR